MEISEIKKRLESIKHSSFDDEIAHSLEDDLFFDFIESLSNRKDSIGKKSKLIISSKDIEFGRYCS